MKITYIEEIETKTALDRNKYCQCGQHEFEVVHLVQPYNSWFCRCALCETEGPEMPTRAAAMREWKKL